LRQGVSPKGADQQVEEVEWIAVLELASGALPSARIMTNTRMTLPAALNQHRPSSCTAVTRGIQACHDKFLVRAFGHLRRRVSAKQFRHGIADRQQHALNKRLRQFLFRRLRVGGHDLLDTLLDGESRRRAVVSDAASTKKRNAR
jgi:hypothetical protein